MRIYFSQYVTHEDGSRPTLNRMVFGVGFRRTLTDFTKTLFPCISALIFRAVAHGHVCTLVRNGDKSIVVPSRSIRFVITLKF